MLANMNLILRRARAGRYAIGAFNVYNLETIKSVINAAERCNSPVILQTSASAIKYASLPIIAATIKIAARNSKIPIVLHLDHGKEVGLIRECLKMGYNSVMFDGSLKNFRENVFLTRKAVLLAHKYNASVEAEIGVIGGKEDDSKNGIAYTQPDEAKEFAEKTGIDALAVSIGTSHGMLKPESEKLRIDILREIKKKVKISLVLHGASLVEGKDVEKARRYGAKIGDFMGVPKKEIRQAIREGISKINVDTDLRIVFSSAMREFYSKNPGNINPRDALSFAEKALEKNVEEHIRLFGSYGRA